MALISGMMTCSSFYVTAFPNGLLLGTPSYSAGGGVMILGRTYTYMMESQFGRVADWERKYLGKEAYGHQGASGKEASGVRDA